MVTAHRLTVSAFSWDEEMDELVLRSVIHDDEARLISLVFDPRKGDEDEMDEVRGLSLSLLPPDVSPRPRELTD